MWTQGCVEHVWSATSRRDTLKRRKALDCYSAPVAATDAPTPPKVQFSAADASIDVCPLPGMIEQKANSHRNAAAPPDTLAASRQQHLGASMDPSWGTDYKSSHMMGLFAAIALSWALHAWTYIPTEPFFNNDETRHFMTGVFLRDFLWEGGMLRPIAYARDYFLQYPALSILTWPPFFYAVEGAFFSLFGISLLTGKVLVGLHATIAAIYIYRLACITHRPAVGVIAALIWGLSPQVFELSRQVMLEIPTAAYSIAAVFHFYRYLQSGRRSDIVLASLATSAGVLTRFDGFYVFVVLAILGVANWKAVVERGRDFAIAIALGICLVVPYYLFMIYQIGWFHWHAISVGTNPDSTSFFAIGNVWIYLSYLPSQVTWPVLLLAVVGAARSALLGRVGASLPWWAVFAGTFLMAVPVAEVAPRHTIYLIPTLAVFAGDTLFSALPKLASVVRFRLPATALLVTWLAYVTVTTSTPFVRGYEAAALYVIENLGPGKYCLFDGYLDADFTYHVRLHDKDRRVSVLRGDKLLYSVLSDPHAGYKDFAGNSAAILETIHRHDPRLVVLELPLVQENLPPARMLRETILANPDEYQIEARFPLHSNVRRLKDRELVVFRKLTPNPEAVPVLSIEASGIEQPVGFAVGTQGGNVK